ncbi:MAG: GNAT family N-acetyltransferase [Chloroflexi bacterium]|nr:GNAT family N-acetyltransferase [Chloroflexota bacterium]
MFAIREMTDADLDNVLALRRDWLSRESETQVSTEDEVRWFSGYCGNDRACALVATVTDAPVGYCLVSWQRHPTMTGTLAEIDEIHVARAWSRQGIGRQLIERARKTLALKIGDLTAIRARVDRQNEEAGAFWRALGFEHFLLEYTDYLD